MSKNTPAKPAAVDVSRFCKSSFTITFAIEVLGMDVWHDCNEGWLDLGPCSQGIKIQYQLYPGQTFDVDILIWPHVAKIWCGAHYGWVRTWQFLERRFLTFTIRHLFPVRVAELAGFTATVAPTVGMGSLGANAKNDKNVEVFLPAPKFGEQRYFAPVVEGEESLVEFIVRLIWEPVTRYIPANFMDELFDVPQTVTDVRHQDAIIYHVREVILNTNKIPEEVEPEEPEEPKIRDRRESKMVKEKEKEKKKVVEVPKVKFEIKLSGDAILAGIGRIVSFERFGDCPPDLGEIITIISSNNLPAQDDMPVFFVNVDSLTNIPVDALKKLRISQIYTRWIIENEVHDSEPQSLRSTKDEVNFNDHHALPVDAAKVSQMFALFLDYPYEIQLRGIRSAPMNKDSPKFFGYQKGDHEFGVAHTRRSLTSDDVDILIAVTQIDTRTFPSSVNKFLRGEYPLYAPTVNVLSLEREGVCTNDINHIKVPVTPNLVVPPYVVLQAQMNLEVSMGYVGCKPKKLSESFSRLYCLINNTDSIMAILRIITEINEELLQANLKDDSLTGFALDTGNLVVLYVEGPTDGQILQIWQMTADFHPTIQPVFSTSARYSTRIYAELLLAAMPFYILKMYVPLGVLLACPPLYARPALPLPTRSAVLKLGRLIAGRLRVAPCRSAMPTAAELKSFRLELCVSPKPISLVQNDEAQTKINVCTLLPLYAANAPIQNPSQTMQKINWENK